MKLIKIFSLLVLSFSISYSQDIIDPSPLNINFGDTIITATPNKYGSITDTVGN